MISAIIYKNMNNNLKRLGFVGIIIDDREKCSGIVDEVLSQHVDLILARTGLPRVKENSSVITFAIDVTTDEFGILKFTKVINYRQPRAEVLRKAKPLFFT
jgi:putative iron-only hydrogenase system regulator